MHTNIEIVCIEQKEHDQSLLRADFKLVKFLHSATEHLSL